MPPPLPKHPKNRSRIRRWIVRPLLILAAGLAALLAAVGTAAIILAFWPDSPPPDDADLIPHALHITTPTPNPADHLPELEIEILPEEHRQLKALRKPDATDTTTLAGALTRNAAALATLRAAALQPSWKFPLTYRLDEDLNHLTQLRSGSDLLRANALDLTTNGNPEAALEEALTILSLGKLCEAGGGPIIHKLVAITVTAIGQDTLLHILDHSTIPDTRLRQLDGQMAGLNLDPETFADAFRCEYQTFKQIFEDIADGTISADEMRSLTPGPKDDAKAPLSVRARTKAAYFQPNKTNGMMAHAMRTAIADATRPRTEARWKAEIEEPLIDMKIKVWPMFASPNAVGNILYLISAPVLGSITDHHAQSRATHELLRIRIAAERFRHATGTPPTTLQDLVPTYLPAIATDPFDGQPLRFNPETHRAYSIGSDLIDQGGHWEPTGRYRQNVDKRPHQIREEPAVNLPTP